MVTSHNLSPRKCLLALILAATISGLLVQDFLRVQHFISTMSSATEEHQPKILFLITDYKSRWSSPRIRDLVSRYKETLGRHPAIDFRFVYTNNFKGITKNETQADDGTTISFGINETQHFLKACAYCRKTSPWGWTSYSATVLAVRLLWDKGHVYDYVWTSDPDAEFLGDLGEWLTVTTHKLESFDLVSSLVMANLETAKSLLTARGMYARIHKKWRWNEAHGKKIRFGVFTQITMYSTRMIQAVEQHLDEASFVELFLPFVCEKYVPFCTVGSLNISDVGFINNSGNVFSGEQNMTNFHAIASMDEATNKWYHPLKFDESWMVTTNISGQMEERLDHQGRYGGKCASQKCLMAACNETAGVVDNCLFVVPNIES